MSIRYKLYTRWWFHWNQSKFTLISPHLIYQLGTKLDIMPTHAILGWNNPLHHSLSPKVMHVSAWTILARFDNFIEFKECNNTQPGNFDFDVYLIRKQVAKPINDTNYSRSYVTWLVALPTQNGLKILAYNTVTVYQKHHAVKQILRCFSMLWNFTLQDCKHVLTLHAQYLSNSKIRWIEKWANLLFEHFAVTHNAVLLPPRSTIWPVMLVVVHKGLIRQAAFAGCGIAWNIFRLCNKL